VNEFDPALAGELEWLSPPSTVAPDWTDVLARAGYRRRPVGAVVMAVLLVGIALLAAPALGVQGKVRELLGVDARPHLRFVAELQPVAGSGSGTVVAMPLRAFTRVGSDRTVGFTQTIGVTVRFSGLSGTATAARIRLVPPSRAAGRGFVVRLCGPCVSGTTLVIHRRGVILALLTGRATAEVATAAHPDGELRGQMFASR
jgi:hypothetical protein